MNKGLKVTKELQINADISKVWDAIVNPEIVKQYFFGTQVESDWKVGSPITFSGNFDGKSYRDKGTILAIESGKFLQYSYWSEFSGLEDKEENYSIVTYKVAAINSAVLLTLIQQGFANEQAHEHGINGWGMVLKGMKDLIEKG